MPATLPRAPAHLSKPSKALWRRLVAAYQFEQHQLRLLRLALEALDRVDEARRVVGSQGAYFTDRYGQPRAHPAIGVEKDSSIRAARLFRELAIDVPADESRLPRPAAAR